MGFTDARYGAIFCISPRLFNHHLLGLSIHASWDEVTGCFVTPAKPELIAAGFIYAICFDTIAFFVTAWKLVIPKQQSSKLVKLMFTDGLVYMLIV